MEWIKKLIKDKRAEILARWEELILASYPADAQTFLRQQLDGFQNPVGATVRAGISPWFDALVKGVETPDAEKALDDLLRIRAVQDFKPSEAVGFILLFKQAVEDVCVNEDKPDATEMAQLDRRVTHWLLKAFDNYITHRELIFQVRMREFKRRSEKLLERCGLSLVVGDDSGNGGNGLSG